MGRYHWHDIGDYLSQAEKLEKISTFASIAGITAANAWQSVTPDEHGDWVNQRDNSFGEFIVLGDKKGDAAKLFENFSLGVATNRDAWCYNASKPAVASNMVGMIEFYNSEVTRFNAAHSGLDKKARESKVESFINTDPTQISWTRALKQELAKDQRFTFEAACLTPSLYRPFSKQWLYYNRKFNEMVYQMPRIFPSAGVENRVICVSGNGARYFSALMTNTLPCLDNIEKGQCFPLYLYDSPEDQAKANKAAPGLFDAPAQPSASSRRDAITDEGLAHFSVAYPSEVISKEDLFYYVYGLLHSPEYREKYADNLSKELPRIPAVKTAADFWAYSKAGRALAELHIDYETVPMYSANVQSSASSDSDYRVTKMKYGKKGKDKDLSTLHYNAKITVTGIPLEAYDYIVNGKPALDWVVERQCVSTHKDSGITNDANDWACETMNNPKYPLELFLRVVTVSLETMKIVNNLPTMDLSA